MFSNVRHKTNYNNIFIVMNRYFKFAPYIVAKKNLKRKKFNENNDKTDIFNFRNVYEYYFW